MKTPCLLVFAIACQPEPTLPAPVADPHAGHDMSQHQALPADPPILGTSLYQLDLALTDQDGVALPLTSLQGGPALVSMVYTSCTAACPMIVADLQRVELALPVAARSRTHFLLVSMDPEHDDTAALSAMAKRHGVDEGRWHFTRGSAEDVRELAAALGIRYRALPEGGFNHSAVLTLLDGRGTIVSRVEGLGQPVDALVAAIVEEAGG